MTPVNQRNLTLLPIDAPIAKFGTRTNKQVTWQGFPSAHRNEGLRPNDCAFYELSMSSVSREMHALAELRGRATKRLSSVVATVAAIITAAVSAVLFLGALPLTTLTTLLMGAGIATTTVALIIALLKRPVSEEQFCDLAFCDIYILSSVLSDYKVTEKDRVALQKMITTIYASIPTGKSGTRFLPIYYRLMKTMEDIPEHYVTQEMKEICSRIKVSVTEDEFQRFCENVQERSKELLAMTKMTIRIFSNQTDQEIEKAWNADEDMRKLVKLANGKASTEDRDEVRDECLKEMRKITNLPQTDLH